MSCRRPGTTPTWSSRSRPLTCIRRARRHGPANSVLDNAALRESGIPLLRHYREPLSELVEQLTN